MIIKSLIEFKVNTSFLLLKLVCGTFKKSGEKFIILRVRRIESNFKGLVIEGNKTIVQNTDSLYC